MTLPCRAFPGRGVLLGVSDYAMDRILPRPTAFRQVGPATHALTQAPEAVLCSRKLKLELNLGLGLCSCGACMPGGREGRAPVLPAVPTLVAPAAPEWQLRCCLLHSLPMLLLPPSQVQPDAAAAQAAKIAAADRRALVNGQNGKSEGERTIPRAVLVFSHLELLEQLSGLLPDTPFHCLGACAAPERNLPASRPRSYAAPFKVRQLAADLTPPTLVVALPCPADEESDEGPDDVVTSSEAAETAMPSASPASGAHPHAPGSPTGPRLTAGLQVRLGCLPHLRLMLDVARSPAFALFHDLPPVHLSLAAPKATQPHPQY